MTVPSLEALLDLQAEAWSRGDRVLVEQLLVRSGVDTTDKETVCSLIVGEILLRREAGNQDDLSAEYSRRFPDYAAEVWEEAALPNWVSGELPAVPFGPVPFSPVPFSPVAETPGKHGLDTDRSPLPRAAHNAEPSLPDYQLLRVLGRGGFGTVWLARNLLDHGLVAVKRLKPGREGEIEGIRAYRRCASLHPHLLPILHVGQTPGGVYYTMPLADPLPGSPPAGEATGYQPDTLGSRLRISGPLPTNAVLELWRQLLDALAELHHHGVVHSDVKPDNILRVGGNWKLGDLGLAVAAEGGATEPGAAADGAITPGRTAPAENRGTRGYWPPEGCSGTPTDDLYALAKTIRQVWNVTAAPLASDSATTTLSSAVHPPLGTTNLSAPLPAVPLPAVSTETDPVARRLLAVLTRALSADPAGRYATGAELLRDLPDLAHRAPPARRRWRLAVLPALGLIAVTWFAAGLWSARHGARPGPAQPAGAAVVPLAERVAGVKQVLAAGGPTARALELLPDREALESKGSAQLGSELVGPELAVEVQELRQLLTAIAPGSDAEASLRVFFQASPPGLVRTGEPEPEVREEVRKARDFIAEEREWLRWHEHDQRGVLAGWPVELPWHRAVCDLRVAWQRRNLAHRLAYWGRLAPAGLTEAECADWLTEAESLRETALAEVERAREALRGQFALLASSDGLPREPLGWSAALRRAEWLHRQLRLEGAGEETGLPEELDRVAVELGDWLQDDRLGERDHDGVGLHLKLVWLQQAQWEYATAAHAGVNRATLLQQADQRIAQAEARSDWGVSESAQREWELSLGQTRDRRPASGELVE